MQIALSAAHARHPALRAGAPDTLRGVNLAVAAGEALAVIGPSGAGKTSLLQMLGCALPPTQGQLLLSGQDPWALRRAALQRLRGQICTLPQTPPLPPRQRVVTAVLAARLPQWSLARSLRVLWSPPAAEAEAAHAALGALGLGDKLWERVDRLSGGERQRVGLARALVSQAQLWLVDEPLSALDPTLAQGALALLVRQAHQRGATLVASLHHVELALAAFPRIVGLRDGALQFDLPAAEVTPALLARLYAQSGPAAREADQADPATAPPPVAVTCR